MKASLNLSSTKFNKLQRLLIDKKTPPLFPFPFSGSISDISDTKEEKCFKKKFLLNHHCIIKLILSYVCIKFEKNITAVNTGNLMNKRKSKLPLIVLIIEAIKDLKSFHKSVWLNWQKIQN